MTRRDRLHEIIFEADTPAGKLFDVALLWAILLSVVLSGCGLVDPVSCTDNFVYGIVITAVDAETGTAVSEGLQGVTIRSSTSSDMEVFDNTLLGAGEQAGNFAVVVTAPGYELWTKTDIQVTEDECHVRPIRLTAELLQVPAV